VPDNKHYTGEKAVEIMPASKKVYISMSQGIGAPAKAIVNVGDRVLKGQMIAEAGGFISANIYSSVAGNVTEIKDIINSFNVLEKYIVIENDFSEEELKMEPLKSFEKDDIVNRVKLAGIVGLGGAGFPTSVKMSPRSKVDTLILDGAECEPYLTCDYQLMLTKYKEIEEGAHLIAKALGVTRIKIGIELNKPKCIELFQNNTDLEVVPLQKKYPQGAEKSLVYVCTKRKVPAGKLPADAGVAVQNVSTCYAVYQAVINNLPLYERIMTVAGKGIKEPKNIMVKNGTPTTEIIEFCGGVTDETIKLVRGGPMMGKAMYIMDGFTKKMDSGLLALTKEEANTQMPTNCINCGRCASVCPMHLTPMNYDHFCLADRYDKAKDYGVMNCIECGSCAYVCPAKRSLVQSIVVCKTKIREQMKKGGK